jgi:succinate-semialdehyde dehydrogenase/glutarate-semialdehyde dehydrogenase
MLDVIKSRFLLDERGCIHGRWCGADTGETLPVSNPATQERIGTIPNMSAAETRRAIDAAHAAFPAWSKRSAKERSQLLYAWYELMMQHQDDLARIMTIEQGKPLTEAKGEVAYAAHFVQWFAEEAKRTNGLTIPSHTTDARIVVIRQPVGVVATITPWNFPLAMITRKIAPALAAGCTAVMRPAELTPFSAVALMKLAEKAGIPDGVLNLVLGSSAPIGKEMTSNPLVRKLSFTGSTKVGKLLMGQSAATMQKLSLELGGNAPFIVFDDADIEAAAKGAVASKYRNAGQTCVCANRFYVHNAVYDRFVEAFAAQVAQLSVGNGLEDGVQIGPLIHADALKKVECHVADALAKGGKIRLGGKRHALGGTFYEPTIITDVAKDALLTREETFGPVSGIIRFDDEAEVLAAANDTEFGLAAYVYSRDIGRVWRVAEALETGIVGVNEGLISTEVAPFGGVKASGIGREGSVLGIQEYMDVKYILMGGLTPQG